MIKEGSGVFRLTRWRRRVRSPNRFSTVVSISTIPLPAKTMKTRNSAYLALIVGAFAVLAPFYGPAIQAHAATPQDELDRNIKTLVGVYSVVERNYADPV